MGKKDYGVNQLFLVVVFVISISVSAILGVVSGVDMMNERIELAQVCFDLKPDWATESEYNNLGDAPVCIFTTGTYGDFDYKSETRYLINKNRLGVKRGDLK